MGSWGHRVTGHRWRPAPTGCHSNQKGQLFASQVVGGGLAYADVSTQEDVSSVTMATASLLIRSDNLHARKGHAHMIRGGGVPASPAIHPLCPSRTSDTSLVVVIW